VFVILSALAFRVSLGEQKPFGTALLDA
jgi:hypothetical protein